MVYGSLKTFSKLSGYKYRQNQDYAFVWAINVIDIWSYF